MIICVADCTNELYNMTMDFVYNPRRVNMQPFMHVSGPFMHKKEGPCSPSSFAQLFNFCFDVISLYIQSNGAFFKLNLFVTVLFAFCFGLCSPCKL